MSCPTRRINSAFLWILAGFGLAAPAPAQVTQRLPDVEVTATAVLDNGGRVWVGTPQGAYRIDGDRATRIPDYKMDVTAIDYAGGHVWLATTQGAFRIDGDRAVRVPDRGLVVTSVTEVGGSVWLAATNGAYLVNGDNALRTPDQDFDVAAVVPIDGHPWIATDRGAFRLVDNGGAWTAEHLVDMDYDLNQILDVNGTPWLATDQGAFRVDPEPGTTAVPPTSGPLRPRHIALISPSNPAFRFTGKAAEVFRIVPAGGQIWLLSRTGAFRVDGDVARRLPDTKTAVATIVTAAGHVWIATRSGAFRIDGNFARRIPDQPLDVTGILGDGDRVWLATSTGAYAVDGDRAVRIPDAPLSVASVSRIGGRIFLATQTGAYMVSGDRAFPVIDSDVDVLGAYDAGGAAWLATADGAFRVDPGRSIVVSLAPRRLGWARFLSPLLPPGFVLAGEYSTRVHYAGPEGVSAAPQARVAAGLNPDAVRAAAGASRFVGPASAVVRVPPGRIVVYVTVKDGWLPAVDRDVSVVAVAGWLLAGICLALIWAVAVLVVLALAPSSMKCHRLLMSPVFRDLLSLGLIPFALRWPAVQRHVLRRYAAGIRDALGREPLPDEAPSIGVILERLTRGRTATAPPMPVSYLMACHIARSAQDGSLRSLHALPVPLLASADEVARLDEAALGLLDEHGSVTDPKLARWLLDRSRFLFIVEGEMPSTLMLGDAAAAVAEFAVRRSVHGLVCVVGRAVAGS
ncbi:MAG: hypothetical protein ACLQVD_01500 [Capsulimonadaceae bacterium]